MREMQALLLCFCALWSVVVDSISTLVNPSHGEYIRPQDSTINRADDFLTLIETVISTRELPFNTNNTVEEMPPETLGDISCQHPCLAEEPEEYQDPESCRSALTSQLTRVCPALLRAQVTDADNLFDSDARGSSAPQRHKRWAAWVFAFLLLCLFWFVQIVLIRNTLEVLNVLMWCTGMIIIASSIWEVISIKLSITAKILFSTSIYPWKTCQ